MPKRKFNHNDDNPSGKKGLLSRIALTIGHAIFDDAKANADVQEALFLRDPEKLQHILDTKWVNLEFSLESIKNLIKAEGEEEERSQLLEILFKSLDPNTLVFSEKIGDESQYTDITFVLLAARWGTRRIFETLANAKGAVLSNAQTSALHQAVKANNLPVVEFILEKYGNPQLRDHTGFTPLGLILKDLKNNSDENAKKIVKLLLKSGENVFVLHWRGQYNIGNVSILTVAKNAFYADEIKYDLYTEFYHYACRRKVNEALVKLPAEIDNLVQEYYKPPVPSKIRD